MDRVSETQLQVGENSDNLPTVTPLIRDFAEFWNVLDIILTLCPSPLNSQIYDKLKLFCLAHRLARECFLHVL